MLLITPGAAALLTELRDGQQIPDTYGLRVFADATQESGEMTIGLGFTEQPAVGDQVTETDGLRVFVAPELSGALEDAAIDVAAENGTERLVFRPQSDVQPSA